MAHNHLLEALTSRTTEAARLFENEGALGQPDSSVKLAPVKRVALFAEAFLPKVDGVSKTAYLAMRYLQNTGREVLVFAPDIAPSSLAGVPIVPLPSVGLYFAPETRVALPHPQIAQHLNDFKPDMIHLFSPALLSVSGMLYARQHRIPVIANYQTDLPGYADHYGFPLLKSMVNDWLRYVHNGCHLTLVPSNWTLRDLREQGYHRLRKWGRGVNSVHYHPSLRTQAWRDRLLAGRDPDSLLCVYVGRVAHEKRIDLLIEVARTPGVALTIIGDGALRAELETQFAGTNTHFTGYLFGEDLARAYAAADVFTFTGAVETFGQVVQEAMASGLPAVIINQGGIIDLVEDGVTGFICPPDPQAFAEAVRRLRDDRGLLSAMSARARASAESRPWSAVLGQLEGHYEEAQLLNARYNDLHPPAPSIFTLLTRRHND